MCGGTLRGRGAQAEASGVAWRSKSTHQNKQLFGSERPPPPCPKPGDKRADRRRAEAHPYAVWPCIGAERVTRRGCLRRS
jgi:hypothetical protein